MWSEPTDADERLHRYEHHRSPSDWRPCGHGSSALLRFLESASGLLLTDLVLAETVYVLESFYHVPHAKVAEAMRSLIAFKAVITVDPALLLRALEVYEVERL